ISSSHFFEKRYALFFWGIIALSAVLYSLRNPQYVMGIMNDDAVYVLGARSLWPQPFKSMQVKPDYPMPGLPVLLAPMVKAVDPHWSFFEWISVLMSALSVYLLGIFARRFLSAKETLALMALYAFDPLIARLAGILMPAPYFVVALLGSFCLLAEGLR